MSRIDWLNWGIALIMSFSLHALFILYKNAHIVDAPASNIQKNITHISFSSYSPPAEPEPEPEPKFEPEPELRPLPEPEPKPKTKPRQKLKPKPKPKAKPKIKPEPKPVPKPKQKKPLANVLPQQTLAAISTKPISAKPRSEKTDPILLNQPQTRATYHALLLRHIEVHKIYPKAARRRKIEGKIRVSFTLFANGSIKNLQINGKRSILKKASRTAIDGALPMPKPPRNLSLPIKVEFTMNYFLN
jgi:protein TonB